MHYLNKTIIMLLVLATGLLGIDEEYWIDQDENDRLNNITNQSAVLRTLYNMPSIFDDPSVQSDDDVNEDDVKDDNIILFYNVGRGKHTHTGKLVTPGIAPKLLQEGNSTVSSMLSRKKSSRNKSITPLSLYINNFDENDYKYDGDFDSQVLRQHNAEDKILGTNKTEPETPYAKFYNLEAAVEDLIFNKSNKLINNTWYVPQDFPCWELPVLYGELGARKKKHEVFLLYEGNLINVTETSTEKTHKYKPVEPPMSHVVNKWCEVEPCYGDHTLCLFPTAVISKICDKEYKVYTPTIVDQFSLVNTINTMRNHVANGVAKRYPHLPTAANMRQITYDYDLEDMANAWLQQCLPGPAPCSALDGNSVSHLECTKYSKFCCSQTSKKYSSCIPKPECYVHPIIGCMHIWYSSAGKNLIERDVLCGRSSVTTFHTVQILWAETSKIGCAYGKRTNGDIRVVCNFSPGAPFYLETKLYCGLIAHNDIMALRDNENVTDLLYLSSLGIKWRSVLNFMPKNVSRVMRKLSGKSTLVKGTSLAGASETDTHWGIDSLIKLYKEGWVRKQHGDDTNGTRSMTARLVAKYTFIDESEARCDSDNSVYLPGLPGAICVEKGSTYQGLCYDFGDPTPGYRFIAIAAPIALFLLILYDLFSGVVRQTNNY